MFIKKKDWNRLQERVEKLEKNCSRCEQEQSAEKISRRVKEWFREGEGEQ